MDTQKLLSLQSWIPLDQDHNFPIYNLPFGIFKSEKLDPRPGVAIGDFVIDLSQLAELGYLDNTGLQDFSVFYEETLNPFIELGNGQWLALRNRLIDLFSTENQELQNNDEHKSQILISRASIEMCMPISIPDYTDFYSSMEHATNVGIMFRGKENALMPNWKHLPVGYHGRSGSIVISGTPLHRPMGQTKADDADSPTFGPSRLVDFELEMGFVVGRNTQLGDSISIQEAEDSIFGMVVFNDWSARDLQKWEYVPLGPFLGKNFGSSISPWIVTMQALEVFKTTGPSQDPQPLPYLQDGRDKHYDINLEVGLTPENGSESVICRSNHKYLYWSMAQQLAHHTVNGCNVSIGDLYASGTISGPTEDSYGSMLELSWRGSKPIKLNDGSERKFIQDGDTISMRAFCEKDGLKIGFGEVTGKILPAKS